VADLKTPSSQTWTAAWQDLVYQHTPFRAVGNEDFDSLLEKLAELERLFLGEVRLADYYRECMRLPLSFKPTVESDDSTRHVAAMQLHLFEDAFYALRLDQYANAPDNRGWMNLFRRWGSSPTFRQHVTELEDTFSKASMQFYRHYIEGWPSDVPVPHRWDVEAGNDERYEGATKTSLSHCRKANAPGVFLDPGRHEAGAWSVAEPVPRGRGGAVPAGESPVPPRGDEPAEP
jgi:hypothetical protein